MSERAECVMLNKGPYVVEAVRVLNDILTRMQAHQRKKSAMLRDLRFAWRNVFSTCDGRTSWSARRLPSPVFYSSCST